MHADAVREDDRVPRFGIAFGQDTEKLVAAGIAKPKFVAVEQAVYNLFGPAFFLGDVRFGSCRRQTEQQRKAQDDQL